jgi:uncharacterized protein (TIGR03435 family)
MIRIQHLCSKIFANDNLGGIKVILILSLAINAIPSVAPAQSTASSASQSPGPEPLSRMPANASPSFDVATIKPSDTSALHGTFFRTNGRHVIAYNISVGELIAYAYGVHEKQIVKQSADGQSSLLASHFDIDGLPDIEGHPNLPQSRLMFQKLLSSRFKLAFHNETRELPAYAIQIAKDGPKLALTATKPGEGMNFSYNCQVLLTVRNASVADVAKGMQEAFLDRPVVDQTGLNGRYDFKLRWTPDESQSYCPSDPARSRGDSNARPGLYTAIQEQLGLKLIPTKAPVQVMVIDHLETPSEN